MLHFILKPIHIKLSVHDFPSNYKRYVTKNVHYGDNALSTTKLHENESLQHP